MAKASEIVLQVMAEVRGLAKKERNENQKFNFRGIDAVVNAVGPALRDAGGFIVPSVVSADYSQSPSKQGGINNIAHLIVDFELHGSEGEPIIGRVAAEAFDSGDKATAKAMSVALRTFLLQLLCLPTDEPDPDSFTYESGKPLAEKPTRDWLNDADVLHFGKDKKGLQALYLEAQKANVSADVLAKIVEYGQSLA